MHDTKGWELIAQLVWANTNAHPLTGAYIKTTTGTVLENTNNGVMVWIISLVKI
jgi:hypothetical protein